MRGEESDVEMLLGKLKRKKRLDARDVCSRGKKF